MDKERKEAIATIDDDELKLFGRASPAELGAAELNLVAGGAGVIIDPNG